MDEQCMYLLQLKEDSMWAKWTDVAFSRLDINSDGYIDLDEIVSIMPGSYSDGDDSDETYMVALSKVRASRVKTGII